MSIDEEEMISLPTTTKMSQPSGIEEDIFAQLVRFASNSITRIGIGNSEANSAANQ